MPPDTGHDSVALYDAIAAGYEQGYAEATHQRAYDELAWRRATALLPPPPCTVIDAGCGTGRWAEWLLQRGHRVIGIEQSVEMIRQLERRRLGPAFSLVRGDMAAADLREVGADAVFAMGSLQFSPDPAAQLMRFAGWVRPGGVVAVYVDSLVALVLELLRLGKTEEALLRLRSGRGEWRTHGQSAAVHLYNQSRLHDDFTAAGLTDIRAHGLLVSASAHGSAACTRMMREDAAGFMAREEVLADAPLLVDVGKHILMLGRRPR